jgi:hypothetical protein
MNDELSNYDPSDVDKSNLLAHVALQLCKSVFSVVETDNAGLLMGRDQSMELYARASKVMDILGEETIVSVPVIKQSEFEGKGQ